MVEIPEQFILNTFMFLVWGSLIMWMAAGFTMLEAGAVRTKNASMICLKNVGIYSIAGLAFYFIGYNLMYVDVGDIIGSFKLLYGPSADELALLDGDASAAAAVAENGYAVMSDWFFQMVFVATAASVVSGAIAERIKMWSFFAFTVVLTAFIYPIVGAWTWGGGWLAQLGFQDFAGSTIVHSTGGWAALAGVLVVGPRLGKFRSDGTVTPTPPSNVLIVTLGVFILWFGWFGFNGGSQLALGSVFDAVAMSNVLVNTNLAAAAGVVAALGDLAVGAGSHRPIRWSQRRDRRSGLHHSGSGHHAAVVGGHHRRHRRHSVHLGHQGAGAGEGGRCGGCDSRSPCLRHLGNPGGVNRCGRSDPHPVAGRGVGGSLRVHRVVHRLEGHGPHNRLASVEDRRAARPGFR